MTASKFVKQAAQTVVPKIKVATTTRPMTPHEERLAMILTMGTHFVIRMVDELKRTSLFNHKLKLTANAFEKELTKHADMTLWTARTIEDSEGEEIEFLTDRMKEITMLSLGASDVPDGLRPLYSIEMNRVFKRFGMNVRYNENNELRVIDLRKEGGR